MQFTRSDGLYFLIVIVKSGWAMDYAHLEQTVFKQEKAVEGIVTNDFQ